MRTAAELFGKKIQIIKQNNLAFIAGVQQFFCKGLDGKSFRLWGNVVSAAST